MPGAADPDAVFVSNVFVFITGWASFSGAVHRLPPSRWGIERYAADAN